MTRSIDETQFNFFLCAQELIRVPGSIQPHGFYVGMRRSDFQIVQVSDNVVTHIGKSVNEALDSDLAGLIGEAAAQQLAQKIAAHGLEERPRFLASLALNPGIYFDVLAYACGEMTVLEFERAVRQEQTDFWHLYPLIGNFLGKLHDADSVSELSHIAAEEIKKVSGFGRVLVYRFDDDGHAHVLAEARDPQYHSYLYQRFPASDLPQQARELYVANRIRLICDANYVPSMLVPSDNPLTGQPVDLTFSGLRSDSPGHLRYMKDMGTMASMSVSIVIKGQLWGLISCHNIEPKCVPFEFRTACEQIGEILALRIESKEDRDEYNYRLELRWTLVTMLAALSQSDDFMGNMDSVAHDLLRFASASGAALVFEGRIALYGDAPDEGCVSELVNWISANVTDDVFHTDALPAHFPPAASFRKVASGILALSISRLHRHYLIWFRPEAVQEIDWAGNPYLKARDARAPERLTPRASFDAWHETVTGTSLPWRGSEIEIATEFRTALLGIVLERAEQMAELAEELGRANKELEAFSYSVSHDLRAPMRHIVGFSDLLLEFDGKNLSDRGKRFVSNISEAARFAGKLVDDLLSFSQMGRAALRVAPVDMNDLVESTISRLASDVGQRKLTWDLQRLPVIEGDPAFLQLAIYNLLSNAVKYTGTRDEAIITISTQETATERIFHVTDNGVGFNMEYVHKLFGVFQRLHRMEEFEGTGIGLANVRRIIERHGGRIWATGVPDEGATFSFALPKRIPIEQGDHAKTHTTR
jgi:chemotaxis family two-component system sensor kinase Cph1